jgi:hypothetical protein
MEETLRNIGGNLKKATVLHKWFVFRVASRSAMCRWKVRSISVYWHNTHMKETCAGIERDFFWCRQKTCSPFLQTYWKSDANMFKWDVWMFRDFIIRTCNIFDLGLCSTLCIAYIQHHSFRILKFPFLYRKLFIYFFFILLQCVLISVKRITFSFRNIVYDRLCGLVVRVLGYRFGGPGSIPGTTRKK